MATAVPFYSGGGVSLYSIPKDLTGGFSAPGITLTPIPIAGGGTAGGGGGGAFGSVPTVPSGGATFNTWLDDLLANKGKMTDVMDWMNVYSNEQAKKNLAANLPGYDANLAQESANVGSYLRGEVPADVWNRIATRGAERGVAMGSPGSANANAAMLQALGLTSIDLQKTGAAQFAQQIAQTPVGKAIDWATFLQLGNEERQWQYLANVLKSAPDPAAQGLYNQMMAQMGQRAGLSRATTPTGYTPSIMDQAFRATSGMGRGGGSPYVTGGGGGTPAPVTPAPGGGYAYSFGEGGYSSAGRAPVSMSTVNTPTASYYDPYSFATGEQTPWIGYGQDTVNYGDYGSEVLGGWDYGYTTPSDWWDENMY